MSAQNDWMPGERVRQSSRRIWASLMLTIGLAASLCGFVEDASAAQGLRFSLVKTAQSDSGDFLLGRNGWQEAPPTQHIAILIEHRGSRLLFGTGLGRQIDAQLDAEVPWRIKRYADVRPVRDQLEQDGVTIDRIVLGCMRWEHASGLADYPEVPVLASADSMSYLQAATPPAVLPSQFRHPVRWQSLQFQATPYREHRRSLDLFGDGQVVLVPLDGHGAVGLFLTLADGRRFFFRGDRLEQDASDVPEGVLALQDANIRAALGFYPRWVE